MRCEHDNETLGLTVLDEPAALQSDPTILDLQVGSYLIVCLFACFFLHLFVVFVFACFLTSSFAYSQLRSVSKKTSRAGSRVKRVVNPAGQAKVTYYLIF